MIPTTAPAGLFDPARHSPVTTTPWSEAAARAAITRIVDAALAAFTPDGLWPTHPRDDPERPDERFAMLYCGAGGAIWAIQRLAQRGFVPAPSIDFAATIATLVERNADPQRPPDRVASFLIGDSGLLLLQFMSRPDKDVADRLFAMVEGNMEHPTREQLWGSPGTMLAAIFMAEATGQARWAQLLERAARLLLQQMELDASIGAWVWQQDMYGRVRCFLGGGHGLAGNVFAVLRASGLLPADLVSTFTQRAYETLDALALRGDGCINWHPVHDAAAVAGKLPLVQDCHGSAGIVVRLASVPRTPEWDAMLTQAAELTWRAGPLSKGAGLCHGTAGNGYALLKLWARTGDAIWLDRARAFAMHAIEQVEAGRIKHGQGWHTLWTGDLGVAMFLASCVAGDSEFGTLDVFWRLTAYGD
ncbi:lanthionine synthetase [Caenimonas koreensis DSM 17982]|uniref:Lanthionine synthetase n=1 Tax=Caenimonas koreensis DSM 17982 TaxID=1121255 RepID=A0A844B9V0_9BURK|nr:LanC-like protein [Caenimonas koreensis]MRD48257.1 lanthionine synthetase [Caenimonas koreensis DSM 17982]